MESDGPPAMFGGVDSPEGVEIEVMWVITDSPPDLNKGAEVEHPAWSLGAVPVGGTRWSMWRTGSDRSKTAGAQHGRSI